MDLAIALGFLVYCVYDAWRGPSDSRSHYWATWLLAISLLGLTVLSAIYWDGWVDSVIVIAYLTSLAIQVRVLLQIDRAAPDGT